MKQQYYELVSIVEKRQNELIEKFIFSKFLVFMKD
jgi:hypothetical protein